MLINFYTDNEAKAPTVENFLFTDEYALMMIGQKIQHEDDTFHVNTLAFDDDGLLNVFVWKYPKVER